MKLPYGNANFESLRTEGYFYVDKTRYLEQLEALPMLNVMLLRPSGFGKSLFCSMLSWYYDRLHADRFEELFGSLYIGSHPTPKHNTYMVLAFDFSRIPTDTPEHLRQGFEAEVNTTIELFLKRYHQDMTQESIQAILSIKTPNDRLSYLFHVLNVSDRNKLYLIIDNYDFPVTMLLMQDHSLFQHFVKTSGYMRPFYEVVKQGTQNVVDRIFMTGSVPIVFASLTSGFNIMYDKTTDPEFNEMFGFTEDEITPILDHLGGQVNREEIRTYYNGYRFSPFAEERVYNSDMILYYATEYRPERGGPVTMIDDNVVSDYRKIRAILSIGDKAIEEETLTHIVNRKEIAMSGLTTLFILTQETEFRFDTQALASLLFYMGYLTIAGRQRFGIRLSVPNLVLESLYLDYMAHLLSRRGQIVIDSSEKFRMWQELLDGKIDLLIELTEKLLKGLSQSRLPAIRREIHQSRHAQSAVRCGSLHSAQRI